MEQKIDIGECIRFGWTTFKVRPWYFIGVFLILFIAQSLFRFPSFDKNHEPGSLPLYFTLAVLSFVVSVTVDMVLRSFSMQAHDHPRSVSLKDSWTPGVLLTYFGTTILVGICVIVGFILLIVPGIIFSLALIFSLYIVIEKKTGPIEAMKESMRITKGHRMQLFGLTLVLILLNVLGFVALFVGLLVSVPVTMLAMVHAYRILSGTLVPATEETPAALPAS